MLSIERKKQLSNIIQQAEANNESEENIKTLVSGFTKKYDNENATIEKTNPQKWGDVLSGKMSDKINPAPQENMIYGMYDQSGNIRGLEGDIGLGTVKAAIRTPIEGLKFSLTPEINLVSNIQNLYKSLTAPKTEGGKLTINKGKTPGTFEVGRTPITSGGYKPVEDTMNKLSALLEKTPLGYKTQKELDEAFLYNTALQMGAPAIQKAYNDFKAVGKYNMDLEKLNRAAENYLMKKNAINIGNVGEETVSPAIPKTWKEMTPADIALQKQTETILKNNNRSINNIATNIVLNKTRGTKITDAEVKTNIDKTKDSLNLTLPDLTKEQIDGILASDEPVKDLTLIYNNNKNAINEGYRELINWGDSMGARIDGDSIVKTAIQSPGYQKINKQIQYGINEGSVSIDKYGNFTTTNPKYLDYVDAMNEMNNELEKISGQLRMSYSDDYVLNGNERFRTAYRDNTKIPMLSDQKLFQKTIVDALRAEIRKVEDTLTNGQFTPMAQKRAAYMDLSDKLRVLSERATNQMAKQEAKKMTPSIKSILGKLGIEPTDFIAFNLKRAVIKSGINVASNLASQQSEINKAIKNSLKRWTVKEPIENPKPPIRLKLPEKQTYTPSVIIPENKNIILEDDEKLNPKTIVGTKQIPDILDKNIDDITIKELNIIKNNKKEVTDIIKVEDGDSKWSIENIKDHHRYDMLKIMGYSDEQMVKVLNEDVKTEVNKNKDIKKSSKTKNIDKFEEFKKEFKKEKLEYGMSHRPTKSGATADDISKNGEFIPEDVYQHPEYYTIMDKAGKESFSVLNKIRNNPDAEITIYRASPKNEFNYGDWVTLSKTYAKGESLSEGTKVYSLKVKAKDIQFAGDSLNEFGYYPSDETIKNVHFKIVKELRKNGNEKIEPKKE